MKKMCFLTLAFFVFAIGLGFADIVTFGDPQPTASWAQGFNESGSGYFDRMEIVMISNDQFENPGFSSLASGWTATFVNSTYAIAGGPETNNMTFYINFSPAMSEPFTFKFLAWHGDKLVDYASADWSGGGWSITPLDVTAYVPEPSFMTLLLIGIGSISLIFRKH